jgi:hypothetical protein
MQTSFGARVVSTAPIYKKWVDSRVRPRSIPMGPLSLREPNASIATLPMKTGRECSSIREMASFRQKSQCTIGMAGDASHLVIFSST